jgi:outer membrane lipoprotein-sorting protein
MKRRSLAGLGLVMALGLAAPAHADAVDTLREFVRDVKSGRASFTQTVTSADGARKKSSSGQAAPRTKDGPFQSLKLGFRGRDLAAVDIVDAFGQRSLLQFTRFEANVSLQPEAFRFTPPPGADVIRQ